MNRRVIVSFVLALTLLALLPISATARKDSKPPEPEFRAMWVHRFEWPDEDPVKCRANIIETLDNMQKANFNAIVFQVRGQADVLYPSKLEPWSPLIGGKDPGWDPLAFAIEQAHARGIELHA